MTRTKKEGVVQLALVGHEGSHATGIAAGHGVAGLHLYCKKSRYRDKRQIG
jgi:hypothetical protein